MRKTAKDARLYIEDILTAIGRIEEYSVDGKKGFLMDSKTQDAVIRQLSIIGEAAAKIPSSLRARHADIPWKDIIAMRNILIHDYSEVNIRRVWETVVRDVPVLSIAMRAILARLDEGIRKPAA